MRVMDYEEWIIWNLLLLKMDRTFNFYICIKN